MEIVGKFKNGTIKISNMQSSDNTFDDPDYIYCISFDVDVILEKIKLHYEFGYEYLPSLFYVLNKKKVKLKIGVAHTQVNVPIVI